MPSCTIETNGNQSLVVLQGNLTSSQVPEIQALLKQELEKWISELKFDLTKTAILDSSGIGLLVAACNTILRKSGSISVVNVSGDIFQLMQSMRLVTRLNVLSSEKKGA